MYRPSSVRSNFTVSHDQFPAHRFRSDDDGYFGLRGEPRFDVDSIAGGGTLGSSIEGALVSVSGSEVVLDDRHYDRHTLFPHGDSGIDGNVGGSRFHARMDDHFHDRPSSQRGGSGAGLRGSGFHARMEDCLDGFPSSQRGGSGAGLGGSCFHASMDDPFDDRPSSQRGGSGAGLGGSAFMPEWTIVSSIVLPPNVEALALVLVVPAFMTWRFWRWSQWLPLSCQNGRSFQ
jgi:hypothetical protein